MSEPYFLREVPYGEGDSCRSYRSEGSLVTGVHITSSHSCAKRFCAPPQRKLVPAKLKTLLHRFDVGDDARFSTICRSSGGFCRGPETRPTPASRRAAGPIPVSTPTARQTSLRAGRAPSSVMSAAPSGALSTASVSRTPPARPSKRRRSSADSGDRSAAAPSGYGGGQAPAAA